MLSQSGVGRNSWIRQLETILFDPECCHNASEKNSTLRKTTVSGEPPGYDATRKKVPRHGIAQFLVTEGRGL
jgi:hypothetical protein